jgi:hypothetical protein
MEIATVMQYVGLISCAKILRMPYSIDDILGIALRFGFLLIPIMFMVIFPVVLNRVHPFSNGNRKKPLTQDSRFLHNPGQSLFGRITELQFNIVTIFFPWLEGAPDEPGAD